MKQNFLTFVFKSIFIIAFLILSYQHTAAGIAFEKLYGLKNNNDLGYSLRELPDSGFILIGQTFNELNNSIDIYLIRLKNNCDTLWTKTYGGDKTDIGNDVLLTADGGFLLIGRTESYGAGGSDGIIIKTNEKGEQQWMKTYGTSMDEGLYIGKQLENGNFAIFGFSNDSLGKSSCYIITIDSTGNKIWEKIYNLGFPLSFVMGDNNEFYVCTDRFLWKGKINDDSGPIWKKSFNNLNINELYYLSGSLYISGDYWEYPDNITKPFLMKSDENGDSLWVNYYDNSSNWYIGNSSLEKLTDGSLVNLLDMYNNNSYCEYPRIIKSDTNGNTIWDYSLLYYPAIIYRPDKVISLSEGGIAFVGTTNQVNGGLDVWFVKLLNDGTIVNSKIIGKIGASSDIFCHGGCQADDEGYAMLGSILKYDSLYGFNNNMYIMKTDKYGKKIWERDYGFPEFEEKGYYIDKTTDKGFISMGYTNYGDLIILKTNSIGETEWMKMYTFNIVSFNFGKVVQTGDGGYLVGASYCTQYNQYAAIIKLNPNGDSAWTKVYYFSDESIIYDFAIGNDGYYFAGYMVMPGKSVDGMVFKTDFDGNLIWKRNFGTSFVDKLTSIVLEPDGYIMAYGNYIDTSGFAKGFLVRLKTNGDNVYSKILDYAGDFWGYRICQANEPGYYMLSSLFTPGFNYNSANSQVVLTKINSNGDKTWEKLYGLGKYPNFYGFCHTIDGGYAVFGNSMNYDNYFYLIKTDADGNVTDVTNEVTESGKSLMTAYPNPSDGNFVIHLKNSDYINNGLLTITDLLGREVYRKNLSGFDGKEPIKINNFQKGMFLIKLQMDGKVEIGKVIVN